MSEDNNTIGLIGIGLMGAAIAELLVAEGFQVVGFDIDYDKAVALRELGGWSADSPKHVAEAARRIILSLPDSTIVKDVIEGADGILTASTAPSFIIDTTTGDPDDTIAIAARLEERNIALINAPVSGSSQQLRDRDALIMVGAEEQALQSCRDILDALSPKVSHLGPPGSGAKAKLAGNLIIGLNRLALAEGLVFAEKLGLDLDTFLELLKDSPAYSVAMDVKGRKMLTEEFSPQSRIRQHHKDLTLILKHARASNQHLPLTATHIEILEKAIEAGDGDLDNAAVIRQLKRQGPS